MSQFNYIKKTRFIILFNIVLYLTNISFTNAQTWNIGYPDSTKVKATLIGDSLIIKGIGNMKNYPAYKTWKNKIVSVYIESGVTNIGHHAFYNCSLLNSVTISEGVNSIGESAFKGCNNLNKIVIPQSVIEIKKNAFTGCKSLESIIIPDNVIEIGNYAFYECYNLEYVLLGKSLNQIGDAAFRACHNLSSITIPQSTEKIGKIAFRECYNLNDFIVEHGNSKYSSVKGVLLNKRQDTLLSYPNGKEGKYRISKNISVIGNSAFASSKINSVYIPNTVKKIGSDAFRYCHNLKRLNIPNSVKEIGILSFANCNSLISIKLGRGISEINMYLLSQNENLLNIKVKNKKYSSKKGVLYTKSKDTLIMYPRGRKGGFVIPKKVKSIKKGAFEGCQGLSEITIPESVTSIGELAFQYNRNLKRVINKSATPQIISDRVFYYMKLQKVKLFVHENAINEYKKTKVWKKFGQIKKIEL